MISFFFLICIGQTFELIKTIYYCPDVSKHIGIVKVLSKFQVVLLVPHTLILVSSELLSERPLSMLPPTVRKQGRRKSKRTAQFPRAPRRLAGHLTPCSSFLGQLYQFPGHSNQIKIKITQISPCSPQ